jgi:hypothetical protein
MALWGCADQDKQRTLRPTRSTTSTSASRMYWIQSLAGSLSSGLVRSSTQVPDYQQLQRSERGQGCRGVKRFLQARAYTPGGPSKSRTNIQNVSQMSYPDAGGLANLLRRQPTPSAQRTATNEPNTCERNSCKNPEQLRLSPVKTECSIDTGERRARQNCGAIEMS